MDPVMVDVKITSDEGIDHGSSHQSQEESGFTVFHMRSEKAGNACKVMLFFLC